MSKELFDENERYKEGASLIDIEVYNLLLPVFERLIKEGYKIRQIEYIMRASVLDISLDEILNLRAKESK